jgi:hypothetical protein
LAEQRKREEKEQAARERREEAEARRLKEVTDKKAILAKQAAQKEAEAKK